MSETDVTGAHSPTPIRHTSREVKAKIAKIVTIAFDINTRGTRAGRHAGDERCIARLHLASLRSPSSPTSIAATGLPAPLSSLMK